MLATEELPELLTPKEIATRNRVTPRVVEKWCSLGMLSGAYKIANLWRIPRTGYLNFLRDCNPGSMRDVAEKQNAQRRRERRELRKMRADAKLAEKLS